MADDADFELLAASLRADDLDLAAFLEVLAVKLENALPYRTRIVRKRTGLLSREKRVHAIEVDFGESKYQLAQGAGELEARAATVVRGIVVRSEQLPLEGWIDSMARTITAEAQETEQGRRALARRLGAGG